MALAWLAVLGEATLAAETPPELVPAQVSRGLALLAPEISQNRAAVMMALATVAVMVPATTASGVGAVVAYTARLAVPEPELGW